MAKKTNLILTALLGLALTASAGCGLLGGSDTTSQAFDTPAQVLASEGESRYRDGDFDEAAELFQQLKDRYPYSKYALLADLRVGDAYFKAERYEEAALAYDDFIRLHPKNEAVPYALYQMGMVFHQQMTTPDRDPANARKASQIFERLIKRFPGNEWAIKAKPRLQEATQRMANHDMTVGRFYFNTDRYRAAMGRFLRVLEDYPDVGLYDEAMEYYQKAQIALAENPDKDQRTEAADRRDLMDDPISRDAGAGSGVTDDQVVTPPIGGIGGGAGI